MPTATQKRAGKPGAFISDDDCRTRWENESRKRGRAAGYFNSHRLIRLRCAPLEECVVVSDEHELSETLEFAGEGLSAFPDPRFVLPDEDNGTASERYMRTDDSPHVVRTLQRMRDSAKHIDCG